MNILSLVMACFSMLGAFDRIIGGKLKLAKEFERGFMLFGVMALSMIGMIVISPVIADFLAPAFSAVYNTFGIDPSVIPAIIFANDMGGAPLATQVAANSEIGGFNALVVSSMMGATVSFTIPLALNSVKKEQQKELLLGLLCGIVTIPIGCFVSGLVLGINILSLLLNLLLIVIIAAIIAVGLIVAPDICVKIFSVLGFLIKALITVGLALSIWRFLTGMEIIKGLDTIENGAAVCLNASIVMSGSFVLINIISRLLSRPLKALGKKVGINETSAMGFVSSLASNAISLEMIRDMDKKGVMVNSAFMVSAAFTFAGHLAFTLAFNSSYVFPMILGKLISGASAVALAFVLYKKLYKD